jgi:hypothetical protein
LACAVLKSPVGDVLLAATAAGLVRAVFADHVEPRHSAIAARLGIPIGTVKRRIRLALQRLQGEITPAPEREDRAA